MKPGCSFKALFLIVLLAAGIYYIYQTRWSKIIKPTEEKIKTELIARITRNISQQIQSATSDSVKSNLQNFKKWISEKGKDLKLNQLEKLSKEISTLVKENLTDSKIFTKIQKE